MKICNIHNEEHVKKGNRTGCKSCNREYQRKWINANRETHRKRVRENNKRIIERNRKFICDYLLKNSCIVCGESDIVVLDFDHLDPETKTKTVSELVRTAASLDRLVEEVSKCQVLCANCHRRKTAKEFGWAKLEWQ